MMGQVNDAPPMDAFSAFYDSGQANQPKGLVTKSWIIEKSR